jgi:hypothetical protein
MFYDAVLGLDAARLPDYVAHVNLMLADAGRKRAIDDTVFEGWLRQHDASQPVDHCVDAVGYYAARAIAEAYGVAGLRESIEHGPNHFLTLYNTLDVPPLESRVRG